jgi:ferrous iron transport protein A
MMKSLDQAPVGSYASIVRLHGRGATKRRLMEMGLTRGEQVYVRKVAPLGDPVEITVRGYELSLRKADAAMVEIAGP